MVMASLTKRLVGKGTRHEIEYDKELMLNVPAISWIAVMSVA